MYACLPNMKSIKDRVFKFSGQKYTPHALRDALTKHLFGLARQGLQHRRLPPMILEPQRRSGTLWRNPRHARRRLKEKYLTRVAASNDAVKLATFIAREEYLACAVLIGSDRKRYGKLI
jgi:hypothetical protein